jgi:hypothetical protein
VLKIKSQTGLTSSARFEGELLPISHIKNDEDTAEFPSWKDNEILKGAVRYEMYLRPHEYALLQFVKRNVFTCYRAKKVQPAIALSTGGNHALRASTKPLDNKSLEIAKELVHAIAGTPEERQPFVEEAIKKNKKSRKKVLEKWPELHHQNPEPIQDDSQLIGMIALLLNQALKKPVAKRAANRSQPNKIINDKDRLIKELTDQRDQLMAVIENGPDPMNYLGTVKLLTQRVVELSRKPRVKH